MIKKEISSSLLENIQKSEQKKQILSKIEDFVNTYKNLTSQELSTALVSLSCSIADLKYSSDRKIAIDTIAKTKVITKKELSKRNFFASLTSNQLHNYF